MDATIFDAAAYILTEKRHVATMKLQRMLFYAQMMHLGEYDEPLFDDDLYAWTFGPVNPDLYDAMRGEFVLSSDFFATMKTDELDEAKKHTLDAIIGSMGHISGADMAEMTLQEAPYCIVRERVRRDMSASRLIPKDSMRDHYMIVRTKTEA